MITLLAPTVAILVGFVLLIWSADKFVLGASNTARSFSISPLIVGIVIVGLGTSAPEMLVSSMAAFEGNTGLSIGNAIGSNITNIGLMLGITALFYPLHIHSKLLKREMPVLLAIMLLSYYLLFDQQLSFIDGVILLGLMIAMLGFTIWEAKSNGKDSLPQEILDELPEEISKTEALKWLVVGIIVLIASSRLLVWGSIEVAEYFQVSDLIIGLTIVAIGTSLPELATTIAAARKKEFDLAVGNIIGSNMFNILGVMALPGLIRPGGFDSVVISRDYPVMLGLTIALLIFSIAWHKGKQSILGRVEGGLLLLGYIAYMVWLYMDLAG
ncbi:calcium/sodium antiporter [Psychromonas sp. 14N.309.X.WAT.B.A12]|uniref:calcium/sodium antiporter n=1 Tax=Psychromonas sp. 14N.309.X.WAT.B.A12 TaxID=2998322 RepID=UPI0025AFF7D5|nr:calcium/sodium antiporter [Psychromonas sp. 14N.309.X.WAT.B.A12]MDN2664537.1 calcium/sodium antiporter [Psychromonas sp. 14N.309.X.WAT.B.A12]